MLKQNYEAEYKGEKYTFLYSYLFGGTNHITVSIVKGNAESKDYVAKEWIFTHRVKTQYNDSPIPSPISEYNPEWLIKFMARMGNDGMQYMDIFNKINQQNKIAAEKPEPEQKEEKSFLKRGLDRLLGKA